MSPRQAAVEVSLYAQGYTIIFTWAEPPNAYYPPHSHAGRVGYVILEGEMTVCYHSDYGTHYSANTLLTYRQSDGVRIESGQVHEVWTGDQGCTCVVGK
ncbi:hypothetical protein N658DRAFT_387723, partial [Parathielavia hyrcaniae]